MNEFKGEIDCTKQQLHDFSMFSATDVGKNWAGDAVSIKRHCQGVQGQSDWVGLDSVWTVIRHEIVLNCPWSVRQAPSCRADHQ